MAKLGIKLGITSRTGIPLAQAFTCIDKIMLDREGTGASYTTTATAIANVYSDSASHAAANNPLETFAFNFTYTEPCPCNGITPCTEETPCPDGCNCLDGVCAGGEGSTTCTDVWDEALIACKALTSQDHLDGSVTAYNYTTGTYLVSS